MHIVEICVSNAHHGTEEIMGRLQQDSRIEVVEYGCLGNCGECFLAPFAMVNGETITVEATDELYDAIMQTIERQDANQAALDKLIDDL